MKNRVLKNWAFIDSLSIPFFLFLTFIFGTGCVKEKSPNIIQDPSKLDSELIVWRKPGTTDLQFNNWLNTVRARGLVVKKFFCKSCDSSLMLLTGPGIQIYIQGPPATGGREPLRRPRVVGEDGPVYVSLNYKIDIGIGAQAIANNPQPINLKYSKGTIVKVAVFDTGLDLGEFVGYLYSNPMESCIRGGRLGWNFADSTSNVSDNHLGKHGTTVGRLITDQVNKYLYNPVQILPVKTHGANGVSDLYSVLCGFAYAKERGANIINASFGFYTPRLENYPGVTGGDPKIILLKKYVEYYLTQNKILLIAAAGNKDDENERSAFAMYDLTIRDAELRNLDQVSFYPASLSRDPDLPNVFTVTTIDTARPASVSPFQNFSKNVVDIGVQADAVLSGVPDRRYIFFNPRSLGTSNTVEGSSFATPIITGKFCALYDLYKAELLTGSAINKIRIMSILKANRIIREYDPLSDKIRNGQIAIK